MANYVERCLAKGLVETSWGNLRRAESKYHEVGRQPQSRGSKGLGDVGGSCKAVLKNNPNLDYSFLDEDYALEVATNKLGTVPTNDVTPVNEATSNQPTPRDSSTPTPPTSLKT
ncbi:hypothetical protein Patl1_20651 [Pistacia atlantica]|uniref:Uncharacterized protein n=1 Tax=Pistacia atlantica TaxID=434234 RepID=A0ACC1BIC6_9ROSI|nr:hypothetical protein Patl1_20651 [Pistacia atlantica]